MEDGYSVIKLDGGAVHSLRHAMQEEVGPLEAFRPENLRELQVDLVKQLYTMAWTDILRDNRSQLESVVGAPLLHQREPYMRILRSGVPEDSVGIHRDTHYGATPNEWVLWIPLTDAVKGAELTILPGSHLQSEEAYPWKQEQGVERFSKDHWLGFMWAPKKMDKAVEDQCVPVPCRVGKAILFNTACVHGIKVNRAPWTRWSIDVRLVSAKAQIKQHGIHGETYVPL